VTDGRAPSPGPPAADACVTMADVRAGIDALDRELVGLLARRQGYIEAAARIKPQRSAVYDAARIEAVIANVRAAAAGAGLSPAIAEPVWRLLIERCIAHETETFDRIRA
jgi:isochorismate pyruvate lyase